MTLLISSLFGAFLFLCVVLFWGLEPQELGSHQNAFILPLILCVSTGAGLGAGILVYALARKKVEE